MRAGANRVYYVGIPWEFEKKGHVVDLNIRASSKVSSCGVRRYSGEVPSNFEEVVNIKMAAAK